MARSSYHLQALENVESLGIRQGEKPVKRIGLANRMRFYNTVPQELSLRDSNGNTVGKAVFNAEEKYMLRDNEKLMADAELFSFSSCKRIPLRGEMDSGSSGVEIGGHKFNPVASTRLFQHLGIDKRYAEKQIKDGHINPLAYDVNYKMKKMKIHESIPLHMLVAPDGSVHNLIHDEEQLLEPLTVVHKLDEVIGEDVKAQRYSFSKERSWIDLTIPSMQYDLDTEKKAGDIIGAGVSVEFTLTRQGLHTIRGYLVRLVCSNGQMTAEDHLIHNYRKANFFLSKGIPKSINIASRMSEDVEKMRRMRKIRLQDPFAEAEQMARSLGLADDIVQEISKNVHRGSPGSEGPVENLFDLHQLIGYTAGRLTDVESLRDIQKSLGRVVQESSTYHSCPICFSRLF